jgi:NAD(P)-dependent dehydrogenase (short-subunit alcohol dehydrogenase family)
MDREFAGKVAIVTGAASGIGAAIARELAAEGARVVLADRSEEGLAAVHAEIEAARPHHTAIFPLDVAHAIEVEAMVAFAERTYGALDLAVNNAGIGGPSASVEDYPVADWQRVIGVNLSGVFYGCKYQIAAMRRSGGGAIVNMASILGTVGFANAPAYVAAKHGVVGLTKVAAMENAAHSIRVNAVCPAFIDTPMVTGAIDAATLGAIAAMHPIGRLGSVAEVSALTCFLLSGRASFITGSAHLVDGGYTAR